MWRITLSGVIVGSAAVLAGAAHAADLPFARPLYATEFVSNWYLRGDVGYRFYEPPGGSLFGTSFDNSSLSNRAAFDLGIGYKAKWFRADVTASYGVRPVFAGTTFPGSDVTADITAITTLFNVYFDLGTWYRLTPYVGAGLGFSWLRLGSLHTAFVPPPPAMPSTNDTFDFAWAVMAGVSYPVTPNLLVDTGYRFMHIGSPPVTHMSDGATIEYGSVDAHELRIGLRYMID